MFDKAFTILTTAFVITGVGIALRPGAPTAGVIKATTGGISGMQRAAYGRK
jgi:hypothetical protein